MQQRRVIAMNTHDKIELPPLPRPDAEFGTHSRKQIREYTRAAIKADRKRRSEPVGTDLVQKWQREHGVVLTPGSREAAMVVIRHDEDGKPTVWCDPEIADLVRALNDGGMATVASCSGHGHRPGNIMLADGRVLVVCKDADEAREVESHFPGVNGEAPLATEPVDVDHGDKEITCYCGDIYSPDVNLNACIVIQETGYCPNCIAMEMREYKK